MSFKLKPAPLSTINMTNLIVPISINGRICGGLIDSGAMVSCIGENMLNYLFMDWRSLPDCDGPNTAVAANNSLFTILANKVIDVSMAGLVKSVNFAVSNFTSEAILGLNALSDFKANITFENNKAKIEINNQYQTFILNEKRHFEEPNLSNIDVQSGAAVQIEFNLSTAYRGLAIIKPSESSTSSLIPAVYDIKSEKIMLLFRNDSDNDIHLPARSQIFEIHPVSDHEIKKISEIDLIKNPPLGYYVKEPTSNKVFYQNSFDEKTRYVSNISPNLEDQIPHELIDFSKSGGFGIPPVDLIDPMKIVEKCIPLDLEPTERKKLIDFFLHHKNLPAKHDLDAGALLDTKGNEILMNIPLKQKLPYRNKFYKLKRSDEENLNSIIDFLIFHKLAEVTTVPQYFGSPCFLISRGSKDSPDYQGKISRLLVDTRFVNQFIQLPTSLLSESVTDVIGELNQEITFITSIDLKQAFFSIFLDKDTLDSGISNVCLPNRIIKLKTVPTGISATPVWYRKIITEQIELNEDGDVAPLSNEKYYLKVWFDDLIIATQGDLSDHIDFLIQVMTRLARMNVRINLKKSSWAVDLSKQTIDILGYNIGLGRISPTRAKINKISSFPTPTCTKEIQSFLGLANFLHILLPTSISACSNHLSELTSSKKTFVWNDLYNESFLTIKNAIIENEAYLDLPPTNKLINIIYSDSSEQMYGGFLLRLCIPEDDEDICDRKILNTMPYHDKKLLDQYGPIHKIDTVGSTIGEKLSFLCTLFFENFECNMPHFKSGEFDIVSLLLFTINKSIRALQNVGKNKTEIDEMLNDLATNTTKAKLFAKPKILAFLLSIAINRSVIFVAERGGYLESQGSSYKNEKVSPMILLLSNSDVQLSLLFFEKNFFIQNIKLKTHYKVSIHETLDSQQIFNHVHEILKEKKTKCKLLIGGHFSRSIQKSDRSLSIWQLEALAILHTLDAFKALINQAKLNILCTDSRAAFFIFSKTTQESEKKILRYSLKLSLEYPTVQLLNITGKNNLSDYFSRLGLPKSKFFKETLSPVSLNQNVFSKYENKLLSWTEIAKICENEPDLINFMDKKLSNKNEKFFSQINSLIPTSSSFSLFDKFLNRQSLLDYQSKEFDIHHLENNFSLKQGVLFLFDKPVLPTKLYTIVLFREHYLGLHNGIDPLINIATLLYHVPNKKLMKEIATEITRRCLICMAVKNKLTKKFREGYFPLRTARNAIQLDYCDFPSASILLIVNIFSKFISTYIHRKKSVQSVIESMTNYLGTHGPIDFVTTDNGPEFASPKFSKFLDTLSITKIKSNAYHSESRSLAERYIGLVSQAVHTLSFPKTENWQHYIALATFLMNTKKDENNLSPFCLQFGVKNGFDNLFRTDLNSLHTTHVALDDFYFKTQNQDQFRKQLEPLVEILNSKKKNAIQKRNVNKQSQPFQIGDFVFPKNRYRFLGETKKFRNAYEHVPYVVVNTTKNGYYLKNLIYNNLILRHYNDLKLLNISKKVDNHMSLPKIVIEKLYSLTLEDLNEDYPFIHHEKATKPVTRSAEKNTKAIKEQEKTDLIAFATDLDDDDNFVHFALN